MIHIFKKGLNDNTLLLLHGTGGNEIDMLDFGKKIDSDANILSVRGNVQQDHLTRFFRRIEIGIFDIEDLIFRTNELYDFLIEASIKYGFDKDKVIAVGYSNGANIATNMLLQIANSLKGAILFRPMVPRKGIEVPDLSNVNVFIGAGLYDEICTKEVSIQLKNILSKANANVNLEFVQSTHRLTFSEIIKANQWYKEHFK